MTLETEQITKDTLVISLKDRAAWRSALRSSRPVLAHLNADTTWLLQLPLPASATISPRAKITGEKSQRRKRYNVLIDPWLKGPQSDVAAWFSTQWHVVAPAVQTMKELNDCLAELEDGSTVDGYSYIDCVAISHEFTDHCHEATLRELPKHVPVVATGKAADLVRSWKHFDTVINAAGFSAETPNWREALVDGTGRIPPWLGMGRLISQGNALYYHSALIVAFDLLHNSERRSTRSKDASGKQRPPQAVIYSPHGIKGSDLGLVKAAGIETLALLHGLDDVRIWMTAQLNLGALNGIQAVKACGARYWIATHDEAKKGGGFISWLLQRTSYSLKDAVKAEEAKAGGSKTQASEYGFVELGSGDGMLLA